MPDMNKAKIVLTNYHAFKRREKIGINKGTRSALEGHGSELVTLETEGQMIQRVMPSLMGLGKINVINDEAHHCYRDRQNHDLPLLASFHEVLRPFVVNALRYPFTTAQLRNAVLDQLLARAFACSSCLSHVSLLSGYDEQQTLS